MELKILVKGEQDAVIKLMDFIKYVATYAGLPCTGMLLNSEATIGLIRLGSETSPFFLPEECDVSLNVTSTRIEIKYRLSGKERFWGADASSIAEKIRKKKIKVHEEHLVFLLLANFLQGLAIPEVTRESLIYGLRASIGKIGSEKALKRALQALREMR